MSSLLLCDVSGRSTSCERIKYPPPPRTPRKNAGADQFRRENCEVCPVVGIGGNSPNIPLISSTFSESHPSAVILIRCKFRIFHPIGVLPVNLFFCGDEWLFYCISIVVVISIL